MSDDDQPLATFRAFAGLHLHLASRAKERFEDAFYKREFGLKLAECRIIGITASYGTASFRQICEDGDFEKSYASRLINTLHTQGLVDKSWSQVDQRSVSLSLTGRGRAMHRALHAAAAEIDQRWLSAIDEKDRPTLIRNLELLTTSARHLEATLRGSTAAPQPDTAAGDRARAPTEAVASDNERR